MKVFDNPPDFQKSVLKNGVRVLTEHHNSSRSTSMGLFIDLGTRDEPSHLVGMAHFVEHILFKGTKTRSAYELAKALESVGGEINAFTGRESTCFHSSTLREDVGLSMEILSDLITNSQFTEGDFQKEREVVLHEMDMSMEQLDEYIFDLYFERVFKGHSLARPILGTKETLVQLTPESVIDFYQSRYGGSHLIVSVAGHVNHAEVVAEMASRLRSDSPSPTHWQSRERPKVRPFREFYPLALRSMCIC